MQCITNEVPDYRITNSNLHLIGWCNLLNESYGGSWQLLAQFRAFVNHNGNDIIIQVFNAFILWRCFWGVTLNGFGLNMHSPEATGLEIQMFCNNFAKQNKTRCRLNLKGSLPRLCSLYFQLFFFYFNAYSIKASIGSNWLNKLWRG